MQRVAELWSHWDRVLGCSVSVGGAAPSVRGRFAHVRSVASADPLVSTRRVGGLCHSHANVRCHTVMCVNQRVYAHWPTLRMEEIMHVAHETLMVDRCQRRIDAPSCLPRPPRVHVHVLHVHVLHVPMCCQQVSARVRRHKAGARSKHILPLTLRLGQEVRAVIIDPRPLA